MKIEDHLRNINESLEVIKESIQKGVQERQRNIAFNVSTASSEMLEVYLHKINVLNPAVIIKNEWFTSIRKAKEKLKFDFPDREKIITLLYEIESKRNFLCYGKLQPLEIIESIIISFNKLKFLFEEKGLKWN